MPPRGGATTSVTAASVLCRAIVLRRRLLAGGQRAQAALEVVEDEPDRRLRGRGGDDRPRAVADDEHASLPRRGLELGKPGSTVRPNGRGGVDESAGRPSQAL